MGLKDANLYVRYHEALTAAGFAVLIIDFRGFGDSGGRTDIPSGRLAERVRVETVAAVALGLGALGLAFAAVLDSIPAAYIVSFLVGIGNGLSLPILLVLVSRAVSWDKRGLALGLRAEVNQLAAAIAPVLIAVVISAVTVATGFLLAAGVALGFIGSGVAISRKE